jgi:hypothetical protein
MWLQDGYYFAEISVPGLPLGPWQSVTNRFYVTGNAPTKMLTVMNAYRSTRSGAVASPEKSWVCRSTAAAAHGWLFMRASSRLMGVVAGPWG